MTLFTLRITNNCNQECDHCLYDCAPGRSSISAKNAKKIIDHIPHRTFQKHFLGITGGEVFMAPNLLYEILEHAKDSGKFEDITVQTNGMWAKSLQKISQTLQELKEHGVSYIEISSNDHWHKIKPKKETFQLIKKVSEEIGIQCDIKGANLILPVGRARNLPPDKTITKKHCPLNTFGDYIGINPDGSVAGFCCFIPMMQGNMIYENWEMILQRNIEKDPFFNDLTENGKSLKPDVWLIEGLEFKIEALAQRQGMKPEEVVRLTRERGICYVCEDAFNLYNKERGIE